MVLIKTPSKIVKVKSDNSSKLKTECKQLSIQIESKKAELEDLGSRATEAHKTLENFKKMGSEVIELKEQIEVLDSQRKEIIKQKEIQSEELSDIYSKIEKAKKDSLIDGKIRKSLQNP